MSRSSDSSLNALIALLIWLAGVAVALAVGQGSIATILAVVFAKTAPWFIEAITGVLFSAVTTPVAVVLWLLQAAHVLTAPLVH